MATPAFRTEAERRRADRANVRITADLRRTGRIPFAVTVLDLSQTGCQCRTTSKVVMGDRIWISLPGFNALEAVVRWKTSRGFGCEWTQNMHISVFEHISLRYPGITA